MIETIDISNYTGFLEKDRLECLKASGIDHVTVRASLEPGRQRMEIARQQMDILTQEGIDWSVYIWTYQSWNPRGTINDTIALLDGRPCRWFWLDVEPMSEENPDVPNAAWLAEAIDECEKLSKQVGIYTGGWVWRQPRFLNNTDRFKDYPLWSAEYDGVPNLNIWSRYGGWESLYGKQYLGSGQASPCGLSADTNVFRDELITPQPQPEPTITESDILRGIALKILNGDRNNLAQAATDLDAWRRAIDGN